MLSWHKELWLIDHGASLYFHHTWQDWENPGRTFTNVKDHVLLAKATELDKVSVRFKSLLPADVIRAIVSLIPQEWLANEPVFESVEKHRDAYATFLENRVAHADFFVNEANYARESLV
jgi:hypothetical protein